MSAITRRKLITTGVVAVAGVAGLSAADRIARRYGLIPPDGGTIYGPGETLTYAAQRLLTRHSMAREFPRSMISEKPFGNELGKPTDAFKRHQAAGFADWKLDVGGMVARPTSFSLSDLKSPSHPQPDHRGGLRGGLVLRCRVARHTAVRRTSGSRRSSAGALRCVLLHRARLVGERRYGRRAAPPDVPDDGNEQRQLAGAIWRAVAAARAAAVGVQEREIHQQNCSDRLHEEVRQGAGFCIARSWLCVVCRNLVSREDCNASRDGDRTQNWRA